MRKKRSVLVTLAAIVGALFALAMPGAALAAPDYEVDYAVAGDPPINRGPCLQRVGAVICFEASGDKWWVQDTDEDHASAVAEWYNHRNGSLYRQGACRNTLGYGKWGVCNKDYYETSDIEARACVVNLSASSVVGCTGKKWFWSNVIIVP